MVVPSTSKKEIALKLYAEKSKIEQKITDYGKILQQNNIDMVESLVDEEEFPRNDIDVYKVRHARHQIICLQNDLKALMRQIEINMLEAYVEMNEQKILNKSPKTAGLVVNEEITEAEDNDDRNLTPITKVQFVSPGSPAEDAGLIVGDEILQFGSLNFKNFENLNMIADIVKHKQNQKILLKIKRGNDIIKLNLIPRIWRGRGLLGCNIVLPESVDH